MRYPPTGYIMFSLKKLKFYGGRGPDMRVRGREPDKEKLFFQTEDEK